MEYIERTRRTASYIKDGVMQLVVDTKLRTSVVGLDCTYKFRPNVVIESEDLPALNKLFDKAVNKAHREFWAKYGYIFRDKILVFNTNANTIDLKKGTAYKLQVNYMLSLREPRHIFDGITQLEKVQFMKDMAYIFDNAIRHALDNYDYADIVLREH